MTMDILKVKVKVKLKVCGTGRKNGFTLVTNL